MLVATISHALFEVAFCLLRELLRLLAVCVRVLRHEDGTGWRRGIVHWIKLPPSRERSGIFGSEHALIECGQLVFAGDLRGNPSVKRRDVIKAILARQRCLLL